jgi:hypothetical protein
MSILYADRALKMSFFSWFPHQKSSNMDLYFFCPNYKSTLNMQPFFGGGGQHFCPSCNSTPNMQPNLLCLVASPASICNWGVNPFLSPVEIPPQHAIWRFQLQDHPRYATEAWPSFCPSCEPTMDTQLGVRTFFSQLQLYLRHAIAACNTPSVMLQ